MATGCSSANTFTGRSGRLSVEGTLVARVTQWTVNPTLATTSEWGDSDSAGYTNRAIGRRDGTFTAEGKFDTAAGVAGSAYALFALGDDSIEAVLWMNEVGTDTSNTDWTWHFPCCICTDFSLTVDVDTEEVQGWTASFGPDGIFYGPGDTQANGDPRPTVPQAS